MVLSALVERFSVSCMLDFYNETDYEIHRSRVYDFGVYFNIYPCEDCGFRAEDVKESLEHTENHREVGNERRNLRTQLVRHCSGR